MPEQRAGMTGKERARVVRRTVSERIWDDGIEYAFTRYGVEIRVKVGGDVVHERTVWQRGRWLRWRPLYYRRLYRAVGKAERVAEALNEGAGSR